MTDQKQSRYETVRKRGQRHVIGSVSAAFIKKCIWTFLARRGKLSDDGGMCWYLIYLWLWKCRGPAAWHLLPGCHRVQGAGVLPGSGRTACAGSGGPRTSAMPMIYHRLRHLRRLAGVLCELLSEELEYGRGERSRNAEGRYAIKYVLIPSLNLAGSVEPHLKAIIVMRAHCYDGFCHWKGEFY